MTKQIEMLEEKGAKLYAGVKLNFGRGVLEATEETFKKFYDELKVFMDERGIPFSVSRHVASQTQFDDENYPLLLFTGHSCTANFLILPADDDGNTKIDSKASDKIREVGIKIMGLKQRLQEDDKKNSQ